MAKRALIVGASGGIGRAIAERLAGIGWHILAHGRQSEALGKTLQMVRAAGSDGQTQTAELADPAAIDALAAWAVRQGPLDPVIWFAGGGRSVDTGPEDLREWDRTFATGLRAPMRLTALTIDAVREARGAYLYICGAYAKIGVARMAAHCAARHGLEGFAKALFEEVREAGVRVGLLHPGFVATGLINSERVDPARCIQPSDIAEMAALAVTLPPNACVTEMSVRPQCSPYR